MKRSVIAQLFAASAALSVSTAFAVSGPVLIDGSGKPLLDGSGSCILTSGVEDPKCSPKKAEPAKPAAPVAPPKAVEPPKPAAPAKPAEPPKAVPPPKPAAPAPVVSRTIALQAESLFDTGKHTLKPRGKSSIDGAIAQMRGMDVETIIATGHTDNAGSDAANQKLSERRAVAVKNYMVSQGIPAAKITTLGKGESQPVATNTTAEGRAKNRRVDIEFKGVAK